MDLQILKALGQVAGLAGLSLGVLLILFRDIIRKKIFPGLTQEHGYRLLRLIVILVWSLAVLGMGTWAYSNKQQSIRETKTESALEPKREPAPPKESVNESLNAELENLRTLHKVSLIRADESDKELEGMPKKSYAFAMGLALIIDSPIYLRIQNEQHSDVFELHKLSNGHVELVGYVGPETFSRFRMGLKSGENITIYSESWSDGHNLISLPRRTLACTADRSLNVDKPVRSIEALDCRVR